VTFFLNFLWLFVFYFILITLWRSQMWPFVTNLWLAKSGHNEDGYRKLQKSFFIWLFCDYLGSCLFLYSTSVLNRHAYIGCCETNNYQKHFCFWWSNITSQINFHGKLSIERSLYKEVTKSFLKRSQKRSKELKILFKKVTKCFLKKSQKAF
jgi:hypothetical protein